MGLRLWLALATSLLFCKCAIAEDLLQVYALARAADPVLAAADAQRGIQRENTVQARAALLPQWQLSASDNRPQGDGSRSHEVSTSINQVLFDLGRLRSWDAERTLDFLRSPSSTSEPAR